MGHLAVLPSLFQPFFVEVLKREVELPGDGQKFFDYICFCTSKISHRDIFKYGDSPFEVFESSHKQKYSLVKFKRRYCLLRINS